VPLGESRDFVGRVSDDDECGHRRKFREQRCPDALECRLRLLDASPLIRVGTRSQPRRRLYPREDVHEQKPSVELAGKIGRTNRIRLPLARKIDRSDHARKLDGAPHCRTRTNRWRNCQNRHVGASQDLLRCRPKKDFPNAAETVRPHHHELALNRKGLDFVYGAAAFFAKRPLLRFLLSGRNVGQESRFFTVLWGIILLEPGRFPLPRLYEAGEHR
jgi:hypothetical protein